MLGQYDFIKSLEDTEEYQKTMWFQLDNAQQQVEDFSATTIK